MLGTCHLPPYRQQGDAEIEVIPATPGPGGSPGGVPRASHLGKTHELPDGLLLGGELLLQRGGEGGLAGTELVAAGTQGHLVVGVGQALPAELPVCQLVQRHAQHAALVHLPHVVDACGPRGVSTRGAGG